MNTEIYTEQDCPDCAGYNHECATCDGSARVWVCKMCEGMGVFTYYDYGIYDVENCPACNGSPVVKVVRE